LPRPQEPKLFTQALNLLTEASTESGGGFEAPSINEFFPQDVFFAGTPFALNRVMLIRILVTLLLVVFFWLWSNRARKATKTGQLVPSKFQMIGEIALNFVRKTIAHDQLGEKDGERFLPLLTTIFFAVVGMNAMGIIPGLNIAGTR